MDTVAAAAGKPGKLPPPGETSRMADWGSSIRNLPPRAAQKSTRPALAVAGLSLVKDVVPPGVVQGDRLPRIGAAMDRHVPGPLL